MSDNFFKSYLGDERGGVMIEVTVTIMVFLVVLFGVVEFSLAFYQWNSGTKATQLGARLAAVSTPVANGLSTITTNVSGYIPGDELPANAYKVVCDGSTVTCTCTGTFCPGATMTYLDANMHIIVYGRCDVGETCTNGVRTACNPNSTFNNIGMCNIFDRVRPVNVVVEYQSTGMGYVGRPGGPVPTITVSLKNLQFKYVLLEILNFTSITIPGLRTTVAGEDMSLIGS